MSADDLTDADAVAGLVGAGATGAEDLDGLTGATKREGHVSERARKPEVHAKLARGASVGRYVVLDVLGEGGMGVVYSAYDPELDRRVAIKLLQARASDTGSVGGEQAWLLREAQALARLAHPNVVAVHDVGTLPGDRVFIALELVQGVTLRAWLKEPRSWREVRRVMREAGAGLAAAHAAGLVHRDFKPENVLVGEDGRIRVMDFGLARQADQPPSSRTSDLSIEARSPLAESLTVAGSVLGTPAYMAPELYEGLAASAQSDQFAFGVTLYEALFGQRPFDKHAFKAPRAADLAPRVPTKDAARGVPPRLARVALRAIAIAPDGRFPSMQALLDELAIDPTAAKRRAWLAAGSLAAVGAVVAGTMQLTASAPEAGAPPVLLCKDAARRLAGTWDDASRQAVRTAFDKTTRPFKAKAFEQVAGTLDGYAQGWTAAATETCEATRIRGEQTEDVMTLRQQCLDQKLAVMKSFVGLLAQADDFAIDKATNAALTFAREESVERCADVAALQQPTRPAPGIRAQVDQAQLRLADARAGFLAGNVGRAIGASEEAAAQAEQVSYDPLVAESKLILGLALLGTGNLDPAYAALAQSTWAGLRGKRDDIAAFAALHVAYLRATEHKPDEATIWLELGAAATKRTGHAQQIELEIKRYQMEGVIAAERADLIAASAAHAKALELSKQSYKHDSPMVAHSSQMLAATLSRASDYAKALPHYEHAYKTMVALLGEDHPEMALLLTGLGSAYHYTGDLERSKQAFQRSLEIRERVYGARSVVLIPTLNNYAEVFVTANDPERGLALVDRAQELVLKTVGKAHPYYNVVTATRGELLLAAGKLDDARASLDESVTYGERFKSPYVAASLASRALVSRAEQKWAESIAFDERAIALLEEQVGKQASDLWKPLTGLALAKIALKQPAEARPLLERALAIGEQAKVLPAKLAPARAALASLTPK